ncbi:MAG: helix-turn-helix domain-containing protein [Cyanobacteriota bacterium]|nr:helix-turn-helix domain-containing protein [Cyanobacteriota bacterium]
MAASRLSDAQKAEIVGRYRGGESSTELAKAFGCSPNTVTRTVKAVLSADELDAVKQQRGKGARPDGAAPEAVVADLPAAAPAKVDPEQSLDPDPASKSEGARVLHRHTEHHADADGDVEEHADADADAGAVAVADPDGPIGPDADSDGPGVLPIDDADDFGDDEGDSDEDDEEDDGDEDEGVGTAAQEPVQCRCLSEAALAGSAYLLVDKTVELQPTALSECSDLGPLPPEEAERQALLVYVNPRHAKRHCGRSQRVIQLPDVGLLHRTAPYLLAQGISRVVIEGSLYSLPGS